LLSELILEGKVKGEIDQVQGFLVVAEESSSAKHIAMKDWAKALVSLNSQL